MGHRYIVHQSVSFLNNEGLQVALEKVVSLYLKVMFLEENEGLHPSLRNTTPLWGFGIVYVLFFAWLRLYFFRKSEVFLKQESKTSCTAKYESSKPT